MTRAAFNRADWVSLAEVGEYVTQINGGSRELARLDIQAALVAGCRSLLRWVKDGQEVRESPPPTFWRPPIRLDWGFFPDPSRMLEPGLHGRWELEVQVPRSERKGDVLHAFLRRTDAVRWRLWPASESPQAKQQSKQRPQQPPKKREPASADAQPQPQPQSPNPSIAEVPKLSGKKWVPIAYTRRADTLRPMTITEAARALAEESKTAPDRAKPLSEGYIKNELRKLNVWEPQPRNPLNPPQQRRK